MNHRIIESNCDLSDNEIVGIIKEKIRKPDDLNLKSMALLFFNPSTRTRLSFIKALNVLNMNPVSLSPLELRYLDGESLRDTALSISQYVDIIGLRINGARPIHSSLSVPAYTIVNDYFKNFAKAAECPVINLECDKFHPCQGLADLKTIADQIGLKNVSKFTVSWAYSSNALRVQAMPIELIILLTRFIPHTVLSCPTEFMLKGKFIDIAKANAEKNNNQFSITHDFKEGCDNAKVIYARNWVTSNISNHGLESEKEIHRRYDHWKLTDSLFSSVAKTANYMHCLPVHRGCEAESSVIDSPRSLIREQMKNRVTVQVELLKLLLGGSYERG